MQVFFLFFSKKFTPSPKALFSGFVNLRFLLYNERITMKVYTDLQIYREYYIQSS